MLPDILLAAGGRRDLYFEWVQDIGRLFFWDRDEIRSRLAEKMATAFDRVWGSSPKSGGVTRAVLRSCAGSPRSRPRSGTRAVP